MNAETNIIENLHISTVIKRLKSIFAGYTILKVIVSDDGPQFPIFQYC